MPYQIDTNGNVLGFGKSPSTAAYSNALLHKFPGFVDVTPTSTSDLLSTIQTSISENEALLLVFFSFR